MSATGEIPIAREDLESAWAVLENLAVSLDRIGGTFAVAEGDANGVERSEALKDALSSYVTPSLFQSINEARMRLGQYLPDDVAEALTEQIDYWQSNEAAGRIQRRA